MSLDIRLLAALLAAILAGIALLAFRGYKRLDQQGEKEPARPRLSMTGLVIGVIGALWAGFYASAAFLLKATPFIAKLAWPRDMRMAFGIQAGIILLGGLISVLASRPRRKGLYRALMWWFGTAMGIAFAILTYWTSRMPSGPNVPFSLRNEIVRFSALGTGVVFLLFVLAALLPMILDALEFRGFTSFVGARHVRATKSGFLTVISVLSMAGVAVSSCALCSVTSIMGGFGADLKRKILDNNAHIVVDINRTGGFGDWESKLDKIRIALAAQGGAATPVVAGDAMGSSASNTAGALIRGIDTNTIAQVIDLKNNIEVGRFEYLEDPEKLIELPPDEKIGLGPGGEPYYKGPDFQGGNDLDPSVREYLKKQIKI